MPTVGEREDVSIRLVFEQSEPPADYKMGSVHIIIPYISYGNDSMYIILGYIEFDLE